MPSQESGGLASGACHELAFDPGVAMASVQGDTILLAEVVGLLLESTPGIISQMGYAIAVGDSGGLEHCAHELKGAVKIIGAGPVCESCSVLEKMGRHRDLNNAQHYYTRLVQDMERLKQALSNLT